MATINYSRFGEKMESFVLPNGLHVDLIARPSFHQTDGILTTRFGSVNTTFTVDDQLKTYPSGIAHFLEHKLFEKEEYDAFDKFAIYGADSNAFTSFTRTSYLFSTAENVGECVSTLLDFVFSPYFSDQTVNKEKGIIGQEIQMYEDDANWQLLFGIISNLYPKTPLTADIAGSVQSIQAITPAMLYECDQYFYQPSNMSLMIVGNFDEAQIKEIIKNAAAGSLASNDKLNLQRVDPGHPAIVPFAERQMDVQRPKLALGVRGEKGFLPAERFKAKIMLQIILEMLVGESSADYQRLFDQGLIDNSFGYEIQLEDGFQFVDFYLDTSLEQIDQAAAELKAIIVNAAAKLTEQKPIFESMKREFIGRAIKGMNSNENIANQFDLWLYGERTVFDVPATIEQLTFDEVVDFADQFFGPAKLTRYQILPRGDQK